MHLIMAFAKPLKFSLEYEHKYILLTIRVITVSKLLKNIIHFVNTLISGVCTVHCNLFALYIILIMYNVGKDGNNTSVRH